MPRAILAAFILTALAAIAVAFINANGPLFGVTDAAHESVRYQLDAVGSSIYEFHAKQGRWPSNADDLATTSLPITCPYWKYILDHELVVIVWHKTLKPNPAHNAGQILAYYQKGLISELGRSWVCWGDLRTEYIKTEDLRAYLTRLKK
jgi:hypothetical protein